MKREEVSKMRVGERMRKANGRKRKDGMSEKIMKWRWREMVWK